ncbi:hypothetical protein HK097_002498 [Rhizophlyctis rosea]|uniref:Uncharacterized protein n=1 Tax=Rhizophlyctis rosea TaxID=64517 RepID=A0AAD5X6J3_9FUNG|nr:hypothetical protein HK097_002498 [Rhizophlyctis rosea]
MSVAAADPHGRPTHHNDGYLSEESEYTDDHDDVGSDKVLLFLVPVVVPMIAKMLGRYVMINFMKRLMKGVTFSKWA